MTVIDTRQESFKSTKDRLAARRPMMSEQELCDTIRRAINGRFEATIVPGNPAVFVRAASGVDDKFQIDALFDTINTVDSIHAWVHRKVDRMYQRILAKSKVVPAPAGTISPNVADVSGIKPSGKKVGWPKGKPRGPRRSLASIQPNLTSQEPDAA